MYCINVVELRNTGKCLYKITCRWENKISNLELKAGRREIKL
jgi:hypothetical protein